MTTTATPARQQRDNNFNSNVGATSGRRHNNGRATSQQRRSNVTTTSNSNVAHIAEQDCGPTVNLDTLSMIVVLRVNLNTWHDDALRLMILL